MAEFTARDADAAAAASHRARRRHLPIRRVLSGPLIRTGWGAVVFLVPFLAYATNILHAFYVRGSSFPDAGWSAYLIHDADLEIHNPLCVDGSSWFNSHISPLFLLTSGLGHLLPLTRIQFYAAFIGVAHALPAVAVFWLLVAGYGMTTPGRRTIAALVALLFAFDGLALAIAQFPHFIMFLVGTGMMFLVALALRRWRIAAVFFLLCLGTREDAGFHLFALLGLAFAVEWWRGAPAAERRPMLIFALTALFYSSGVMALQHVFATGHSLLGSEYLGHPPFAGVTVASMATRFRGWLAYRRYIVFPAIVALAWAIVRRNPQIILGYAAFVPWGLLHLAAARAMLGTLPLYYGFPYMFASLWPLIGLQIERRRSGDGHTVAEAVCGFVLLTAASFVPPFYHNVSRIDLPADFFAPPSLARQQATDRALTELAGARPLGHQEVDLSVLALVPQLYRAGNILSLVPPVRPDSIIYFADGFQSAAARRVAARDGLGRTYAVPGTSIRIASDRALAGIAGLTELPATK